MTLLVETGLIVANANSYCSVEYANAYHAARGNLDWDDLDDVDEKEPYLIRATDYIEQMFRTRWAGTRVSVYQALSWPRYGVPLAAVMGYAAYNVYTEIPTELKAACAELALKAAAGDPLAPDIERVTKREKVGPIEVEYESGAAEVVKYRVVDNLLAPFLTGSSMSMRLVRA